MPPDPTIRTYEFGPSPGIRFSGTSHDAVHVECGLGSVSRWVWAFREAAADGNFSDMLEADIICRARMQELVDDLAEMMGVPSEQSLPWLEAFRTDEDARARADLAGECTDAWFTEDGHLRTGSGRECSG
ncbi:hypothetical protein IGS68_28790 (plasmid) [Skermanella sp. TT6]|uniref:Uncharacterized protein n=1 Tax=Skermanella cutis TaxID=2775420 RepID=A0ABX7BFH2_9PROT|nr:hypothetical protein [Skermanella sp. TT6]QQP93144.1 hypothetical protein IGS68_28790 [Skermanella sp. TT6]